MLNYWQPNGDGLTIMSDHILRSGESAKTTNVADKFSILN
jgi:hypothetical protein